jgi:hypothetical protein
MAKAWGQRPSALGLCGAGDDLAYMVAWDNAERTMIAWEQQEAEREAKRGTRKNRA